MKHIVACLMIALFVAACNRGVTEEDEIRARTSLKPFKMELMHSLKSTLASDGPVAALEVCNIKAPQIARNNAPNGIIMGRTSHKLRNPDNEPREWVRPLLAHYVSVENDTSSKSVVLAENSIGYVEPIYVKPVCLTCHGQPAPGLRATIDSLYPEDQATGFKEGEFRGLFWVELDRSKVAN